MSKYIKRLRITGIIFAGLGIVFGATINKLLLADGSIYVASGAASGSGITGLTTDTIPIAASSSTLGDSLISKLDAHTYKLSSGSDYLYWRVYGDTAQWISMDGSGPASLPTISSDPSHPVVLRGGTATQLASPYYVLLNVATDAGAGVPDNRVKIGYNNSWAFGTANVWSNHTSATTFGIRAGSTQGTEDFLAIYANDGTTKVASVNHDAKYMAPGYGTSEPVFANINDQDTGVSLGGGIVGLTIDGAPALTATGTLVTASYPVVFSSTASPASGAACTAGTFTWDASFMYICTASGAWKRAALTGGY